MPHCRRDPRPEPSRRAPARWWTGLLVGLALLTGCSSAPRRWTPAPLVLHLDHHLGSAVSGPEARAVTPDQPVDTDPAAALAVQVELLALANARLDDLGSVDRDAVLVAALGADRPLRAAAWQSRDARRGQDAVAARFLADHADAAVGERVRLGYARGALPPHVSLVARIRETEIQGLAPWVGVAISREAGDVLSVALITRGTAPPDPKLETDDPDDTGASDRPDDQAELVLLPAGTLTVGGEFVLALPAETERLARTRSGPAYVLHISTAPAPRADDPASVPHRLALARCIAECAEGAGRSAPDSLPAALQHGLQGLRRSSTRAASLSYLADTCDAPLAADLALVAERELVDELARRVLARHGDVLDGPALGHLIEQQALVLLAAQAVDGSLLPEIEAALVRRTGELARHPGVLIGLVEASTSDADLQARLRAENRVFLEDNEPSARVRAYDWLAAEGEAPAGYDPLAERSARRSALLATTPLPPVPFDPTADHGHHEDTGP